MLCLRDPDSGGTVTPGVSHGHSKYMLRRALLSRSVARVNADASVKIQSPLNILRVCQNTTNLLSIINMATFIIDNKSVLFLLNLLLE
jgi:hypothetical protein